MLRACSRRGCTVKEHSLIAGRPIRWGGCRSGATGTHDGCAGHPRRELSASRQSFRMRISILGMIRASRILPPLYPFRRSPALALRSLGGGLHLGHSGNFDRGAMQLPTIGARWSVAERKFAFAFLLSALSKVAESY